MAKGYNWIEKIKEFNAEHGTDYPAGEKSFFEAVYKEYKSAGKIAYLMGDICRTAVLLRLNAAGIDCHWPTMDENINEMMVAYNKASGESWGDPAMLLKDLYKNHGSTRKIGVITGKSYVTIKNYMKHLGVPLKSVGGPNNVRHHGAKEAVLSELKNGFEGSYGDMAKITGFPKHSCRYHMGLAGYYR